MKVTVLDDYFDTLRTLSCFSILEGQDVTVWTDHVQNTDAPVQRLKETEALVLFRERTKIQASLLDRLENLKLISQRSVYPHVDVDACTRNGVMLCSNLHKGTPSFAAAELTFGLVIGRIFFHLPMEGSIALLFLFASVYLMVALGIGLFLSIAS